MKLAAAAPSTGALLFSLATKFTTPTLTVNTHFVALSFSPLPTPTQNQNVTQPPVEPKLVTAKYGFVDNAERINSRAAMVSLMEISLVRFDACLSLSLSLLLFAHVVDPLHHEKTKQNQLAGLLRHPARRAGGRQGHLRARRHPRRQRTRILLLEERVFSRRPPAPPFLTRNEFFPLFFPV